MYLVCDIGCTKTNIAVVESKNDQFTTVLERSFLSKDYDSLRTIVKKVFEEDIKDKFSLSEALCNLTLTIICS